MTGPSLSAPQAATAEYQTLLDKVDAFSAHVQAAQAPWLVCEPGCDGCCRLERSAWGVELAHLRAHIATLSDAERARLNAHTHSAEVRDGARCVFLNEDGRCAVYAARPLICRTHGPAVRADAGALLWCGLNFGGLSVEQVTDALPPSAILNLDLLNQMLALVQRRYQAQFGGVERAPLSAALTPAE